MQADAAQMGNGSSQVPAMWGAAWWSSRCRWRCEGPTRRGVWSGRRL